jgi:hypothetical protein
MSVRDISDDNCPNCRQRFEIVLVKFKLAGVQMIGACPNCAMIHDDSVQRVSWFGKSAQGQRLTIQPTNRG